MVSSRRTKDIASQLLCLFLCLTLVCLGYHAYPELLQRLAAGLVCGLFFGHFLSLGGEVTEIRVAVMAGFLLIAVLNQLGIY